MAVSLKHTTQTATPDSADGKISHDAWNEEHMLTLATDKLLGRVSASTGAAEEVTCTDFAQSLLDDANAATARATLGDVATLTDENQTFSGGFTVTEKDLGTISSGTLTLDMGDRLIQKYVNNGAHTLAPGTVVGETLLVITNGASAGTITTSGWTRVRGPIGTTNGDKFICSACVTAVGSLLFIHKMQGTDDAVFGTVEVTDDPYDATGWNGSVLVPTKNAVRDKIEGLSATYQPLDSDLTTWAGLTPSANAQSLVTAANYAAMRALLDLEAGTDFYSITAADAAFQPKDADLTSWAGVTRAAGYDTFAATPTSANLDALLTDDTGSGACVFADTPTLIAPLLGTPTSGTLTNCTGLPAAGVVGTALTAATGQPLDADLTSWASVTRASGFDTFAATPTSANLDTLVTDDTGSGALVFATSPALVTPDIGTPSAGTLTSCTGLPVAGIVSSTSTALGVGSLEIGNASDTTLARQAAGHVTIEGVPIGTMRYAFVPTGTDFALGANANLQAYLPAANDVFTLVANTTYFFQSLIYITTPNTTTRTLAFGLLGAGTGTVASTLWFASSMSTAIATQAATATHTYAAVATAVVLNATNTATANVIWVNGQFRISTGGTLIPSIQFSANPGVGPLSKAGSYFRCWPALSDTVSAAGAWA